MKPKKQIQAAERSEVRILKIGSCLTLNGKSTLTYHVGCDSEGDVQFRIYRNSGGGFYSSEWVSSCDLQKVLKGATNVTAATLLPIFKGRSANNGGFMLSVLKSQGLFVRASEKSRTYVAAESPAFVSEVQALIASGANLDPDQKPAKRPPAKRAAKVVSK